MGRAVDCRIDDEASRVRLSANLFPICRLRTDGSAISSYSVLLKLGRVLRGVLAAIAS